MKMGKVKITIEFLDHPEWDPAVIEMDDCSTVHEAGINRWFSGTDIHADIDHNGQQRFQLKAWKGCPSYDMFQANTEYPIAALQSLRVTEPADESDEG